MIAMDAYRILQNIRKTKPLVHHITNWVTIYDCAAITRSFGALPVMAHAKEEAAEMAAISSSLVLNIGTLTPEIIDAMVLAGKSANRKGIPIVLDAVGVGATPYRTKEAERLVSDLKIAVIKGNAGEIGTLAGVDSEVRGVESVRVSAAPIDIARKYSKESGAVVVITGKQDVVAWKGGVCLVNNGHAMMAGVVGTGCMAASAIGAFAAVEADCSKAASCALACYGIAGELAAKKSAGPMGFKQNLIDEAAALDEQKIKSMARVSEA
jgi:hydroxyethylthiazole kinase